MDIDDFDTQIQSDEMYWDDEMYNGNDVRSPKTEVTEDEWNRLNDGVNDWDDDEYRMDV